MTRKAEQKSDAMDVGRAGEIQPARQAYEERINELEAERAALSARLAEMREALLSQLKEMEEQRSAADARTSELRLAHEEIVAQMEKKRAELSEQYESRIASLEKEKAEIETPYRNRIAFLEEENSRIRRECDRARLNLELLADSFRGESCRLFEETIRLTRETRRWAKAYAEKDETIERLRADKGALYHETYRLYHDCNGYRVHSKNLETPLADYKLHGKNLEAHLADQMGHVRRLQEENAGLRETISFQSRSLVWLMMTLLSGIYNRILPPGCFTRRFARRTVTVVGNLLIHKPLWLVGKLVSLISGGKETSPSVLPACDTGGENDGIPTADTASGGPDSGRDSPPAPATGECAPAAPADDRLDDRIPEQPPSAARTGKGWYPLSFPIFESIEVSIIIPVYNKSDYTFRCLCSIFENSARAYEVIVVDNASSDETPRMLEAMKGLRVIRNERNEGFVAACNRGADAARGNHYLFLNNDTEVGEGWLEAILAPLSDEKAGIVGAKLIYPNGKLQEAGCIIWQDATGWQYGRLDDPERPQYNYRREVDYCSGACLLIRKELWLRLGGFDPRYAPAYYEDTDLCFGARSLGYKVIYQPECRVVHYEGITAGTDTSKGYKSYQQVNYSKFRDKWREVLETAHYKGPEDLYLARERGIDRRILVVDHYFPTFDMDSGSLRMFSIVKILVEMGHKVIFWPDNLLYDERYGLELQRLGVEAVYGEDDFDFVEFMKEYGKHIHLAILSRPHIAINYIYAVQNYSNARIVYDTVDLCFLREERKAKVDALTAGRDAKRTELLLTYLSQRTLVVSSVEEKILGEMGFADKVSILPNVHAPEPAHNTFENRHGLMFIGGFMHQPNEDGVVWFVEKILPLVHKEIPEVKFYVVGSHPSEAVKALASPDIVVTGYVEDVSPYFEGTRVFVSPLRYGAGIKGKIGQSMSYGLPVVTTSIGAEGMGLVDGQNCLICDDEEEFARRVVEVYNDRELWMRLSQNGTEHVMRCFSPEAVKAQLQAVLQ